MNPPTTGRAVEADLLGPDALRSAEMEALWQWLLVQDAGLPNWLDLPAAEARALFDGLTARWNQALPEVASVAEVSISGPEVSTSGPAVSISGREASTSGPEALAGDLIVPQFAEPGCILFLHGGGWAFGNRRSHARFARLLAETTGSRVLAVDYRLAPEHPYPAPLDDVRAAWAWLLEQAEGDPDLRGPLAVAGDSAGANLAVALALDAEAAGRRGPDLILSFYGAFAADTETVSYERFAQGFGLTRAAMARFWNWYVPAPDAERRRDPLVSPLLAPTEALRRLPPLFLIAAGLDPLLSDTLAFHDRLTEAGVENELVIYRGVHHGFMQMTLKLEAAREAFGVAAAFYRRHAKRAGA